MRRGLVCEWGDGFLGHVFEYIADLSDILSLCVNVFMYVCLDVSILSCPGEHGRDTSFACIQETLVKVPR